MAAEQPRAGEASETTPLLGSSQADDQSDLGFDRADLKSTTVTVLTIASLVLASVCLVMLVLLEFAIGFSRANSGNQQYQYPYPYYSIIFFVTTTAFLALPAVILDTINVVSIRRHGRTIASSVNVIADALIAFFVLSRALYNSEIPTVGKLHQLCRVFPTPAPPTYPPRPPPPPEFDPTCESWVVPLVVFIWVFQVAAILFGLIHVALFTVRIIRLNSTRHLRPRSSWLPISLWSFEFNVKTRRGPDGAA